MKYIYHLEKNGVPFYVGYTTQLKGRLSTHQSPKKFNDKSITIHQIDYTDDYVEAEKYWIEQYRQWGFTLLNENKGGGGPSSSKWTKEFKKEMDKKYSEEYYKNESEESYKKRLDNRKKWGEENKEKFNQYMKSYYQRRKLK